MIILNLIPEKEKKEFRLLITYIAIKNFILLLLFGIIFSSIMLLVGKIILLDHYTRALSSNILNTISLKITNMDIKNIKNEIDAALKIQKGHLPWINFFANFSAVVNNGITISSLEIGEDSVAVISGLAKKRQDLIDFEKNINTSGYFKEFKFPYDSLFKKANIIFSITLNFDSIAIMSEKL